MPKKITILEYVNEYGEFVFYGVYATKNPKNAIKNYLYEINNEYEINIEEKIKNNNNEYFVEDICRAYKVELK